MSSLVKALREKMGSKNFDIEGCDEEMKEFIISNCYSVVDECTEIFRPRNHKEGFLVLDDQSGNLIYSKLLGQVFQIKFFWCDSEPGFLCLRSYDNREDAVVGFKKTLTLRFIENKIVKANSMRKNNQVSTFVPDVIGGFSDNLMEISEDAEYSLESLEKIKFGKVEIVVKRLDGREEYSKKYDWKNYKGLDSIPNSHERMHRDVLYETRNELISEGFITENNTTLRIIECAIFEEALSFDQGNNYRSISNPLVGKLMNGETATHTFLLLKVVTESGLAFDVTVDRYEDRSVIKIYCVGDGLRNRRSPKERRREKITKNDNSYYSCLYRILSLIILETEFENRYNVLRRNCKTFAKQILYLLFEGKIEEHRRRFFRRRNNEEEEEGEIEESELEEEYREARARSTTSSLLSFMSLRN